jgi:hypothetical protein
MAYSSHYVYPRHFLDRGSWLVNSYNHLKFGHNSGKQHQLEGE